MRGSVRAVAKRCPMTKATDYLVSAATPSGPGASTRRDAGAGLGRRGSRPPPAPPRAAAVRGARLGTATRRCQELCVGDRRFRSCRDGVVTSPAAFALFASFAEACESLGRAICRRRKRGRGLRDYRDARRRRWRWGIRAARTLCADPRQPHLSSRSCIDRRANSARFPGGQIGGDTRAIASTPGTPGPHNHADLALPLGLRWARLDSNQGPTDYESAALTS